MPSKTTSIWLPRVIFESALITVSILLALGLDEWRENRETQATIRQAVSNFLSEIQQNKARIDDAAPFNLGLYEVIDQRHKNGEIETMTDFISMMDSYSPVALQSTAWETALATGSLAKMDYTLVSALSLTYGLQSRYDQTNRGAKARLTNPQVLNDESVELAIYNSLQYLKDVTSMETELAVVYAEATDIVELNWKHMNGEEL
ncbi:MAG: hypothetical protein OEW73_02050 [Gammaproteobacteria bacterium]|nr:hypothetical protein [Gammaproteobacteria bacterium]MDH5239545.1 hypothetical protein [Gammaproteobacteria bacterium]MDH5260891.1 hypothetical protein [Gammaproteobacteria bacterium]MDH5583564.1 hypothetical protein [Gammaproteobacteria bacterium]